MRYVTSAHYKTAELQLRSHIEASYCTVLSICHDVNRTNNITAVFDRNLYNKSNSISGCSCSESWIAIQQTVTGTAYPVISTTKLATVSLFSASMFISTRDVAHRLHINHSFLHSYYSFNRHYMPPPTDDNR